MRAAAALLKSAVLAADPDEIDRACDDIVAAGATTTQVPMMRTRAAALRAEQARTLVHQHDACDEPERSVTAELLPPVPHFPSLGPEGPERMDDDSGEGQGTVALLLARRATRLLFEAANTPIGDQPDMDLVPKETARPVAGSCIRAIRAYGTDCDGIELQSLLQSRLRQSLAYR